MKISKNILFFLLSLTLVAEEEVIEMKPSSPQTIHIKTIEYNEDITFDDHSDISFAPNIEEETPSISPDILDIPLSSNTFEELPPINNNNLNQMNIEPIAVIRSENKAPILTPISYDEALEKAKNEHKIILVEVFQPHCKFCERMEDNVFTQSKIADMMKENFILIRMNGNTQTLPLGLGMTGAPMHIFISEDEILKKNITGYRNAKDFLAILKEEL